MKAMLVFLLVCVALAAAAPGLLAPGLLAPWGAPLVGPIGPVAPRTAVIGPTVVNAAPGVWPAAQVVHPGVVATSWW